jgi:heme/copper-type cytochrome/quinol oxidase subunit 3
MLALPAPPPPARRRQVLVGMAFAIGAGLMFFGGLLGIYMTQRQIQGGGNTHTWLPKKVVINEVAANTALVTMFAASIMIQWAVYALRRADRRNAGYGLGLTAVFGLAVITAQARIWQDLKIKLNAGQYQTLVYTVTGAFIVFVAAGVLMAGIGAFRALGGRATGNDRETVSAVAMWWHFLTAVYCAVWLFIYVVK